MLLFFVYLSNKFTKMLVSLIKNNYNILNEWGVHMKNEFIVIRGRLKNSNREELKLKIIENGHTLQKSVNKNTTLVVLGIISKKNVRKYNKNIKVMSENEFLEFLKPKEEEIKEKINIKNIKKYINKDNILRILTFVMLIQSIRYTNTLLSSTIAIIASLLILPDLSKKFYNNIVFKITIPVSLFMIAFAFNFEKEKSMIYGTWYVDTMTFTINKEKITIDVIDSDGRHLLNGKRQDKKNKVIINTDYKNFYFEYDEENDSLCYLKNKKECSYYLKRLN